MYEKDLSKLKDKLNEIKLMGWIKNRRPGNAGGVGNTIEDLLDIAENNHQIPDFGSWEIKSQRRNTNSLLTLFHIEPYPRSVYFIPRVLLPFYGWPHNEAGNLYSINEKSFRQTITTLNHSDRGFKVNVDINAKQIYISFDLSKIQERHNEWKKQVYTLTGLNKFNTNPYWTYDIIAGKLEDKLKNLMYIRADNKTTNGIEYFKYTHFEVYTDPTIENFINLINNGKIFVDFDARTGHNHGTKFRIKPIYKNELYTNRIET